MSLLDEDIIGLEDPKCIIKLMRSWASGGDYWQQKTRSQYESCIDKHYLMELSFKYYQYTREEREWMEKNNVEHMPIEGCTYLNFNPYVPDDMIISFLTDDNDIIKRNGDHDIFLTPYLICKDDVIITQLTDKVKIVKYEDIRPVKIWGFYEEKH